MIAGGYFTTAGGVACNCIARWDGSSWQSLGSGIDDYVHALTVYNGQLVAGGELQQVPVAWPSAYIAHWGLAPRSFSSQRRSWSMRAVHWLLSVAAGGSGTLTYQWHKDGVNLAASGRISGTAPPNLDDRQCDSSRCGFYDVVVTDAEERSPV